MKNIGSAIAKAQITNGGPVILVQPENEYSGSYGDVTGGFPDPEYFAYVKKQLRDAGVVVPFINNDACKPQSCASVVKFLTMARGTRSICSWIRQRRVDGWQC